MTETERAVHPAAAVFPMLSDEELADLAEDIRANGLLHPIVLGPDGDIWDGRNRHAACALAGVEPTYTDAPEGADPVAYILASNVQRRQMTRGQTAMAIVRTRGLSQTTQRDLESRFKVSHSRIAYASIVDQFAADLGDLVLTGAETLDKAYAAARARKDAASSMAAQLGALRAEAPDLADLVIEERLTLREALEVLARRRAEERRRKEAATTGLLSALRLLAPPAGDIAEHAENLLASLDPSLVTGGDVIAPAAVERAIAFLEVVLVGLDEREEHRGGTQAQPVPSRP